MKQTILFTILPLVLASLFSQCMILQKRWSDKTAHRVFDNRNVPLNIYDTIISNRRLHYAVTGADGRPILVFIHGSPGSWKQYAKYMYDSALLSKFKIVSIDRPGFGYSDFGKAMNLREQCNIILPLLQSLKAAQPMYLFGHSMGGPVAVQLAAADPSLFSGLVIASGAIDAAREKKELWRRVMAKKPLYWLLPGAFGPSNTELLFLKKDLVDLRGEFKKITSRVYFIHGARDHWVPIENVAFGKQMLVNAEQISSDTLPRVGHFVLRRVDVVRNILMKMD